MSLLLFPASVVLGHVGCPGHGLHKELRRVAPSLRQSVVGFLTFCAWREECQDGKNHRMEAARITEPLSGGRLSLRAALPSADRDVIEKLCRFQPLRAGMLFAAAA